VGICWVAGVAGEEAQWLVWRAKKPPSGQQPATSRDRIREVKRETMERTETYRLLNLIGFVLLRSQW
jgi:hypothetical protein